MFELTAVRLRMTAVMLNVTELQEDRRLTRMLLNPEELEATSGFEPLNKGFADPRLTTWLRRLRRTGPLCAALILAERERTPRISEGQNLERETGLEPATPTLARLCSTTELFPPDRLAKDSRRTLGCQAAGV